MTEMIQLVISDKSLIKSIKTKLEASNYLNKSEKIKQQDDQFIIPTTMDYKTLSEFLDLPLEEIKIEYYIPQGYASNNSIEEKFKLLLRKYCTTINNDMYSEVVKYIPKKWQIYKPMVLFQSNSVESPIFQDFANMVGYDQFWKDVCQIFNVTHIAVNEPIVEQNNLKRIPFNLVTIYGDFGPHITPRSLLNPTVKDFNDEFWCQVIQNNVLQIWAPKYTMFSRGNIVEKQRILTFDNIRDNVVVDLYSGIGYFTLHYLVKGPKFCFCWELNPWSNQGLIRSLQEQKIKFKLVLPDEELDQLDSSIKVYIFQEDNKNCINRFQKLARDPLMQKICVSHINLGLLPSSSMVWDEMLQLCELSDIATEVHIHENCHVDKLPSIMEEIRRTLILKQLLTNKTVNELKLNKVKTYAPDVWHIICDYRIEHIP